MRAGGSARCLALDRVNMGTFKASGFAVGPARANEAVFCEGFSFGGYPTPRLPLLYISCMICKASLI